MNGIESIFATCRQRDIQLVRAGESIRFNAPEGAVTPDIREALKLHKGELLEALSDWNTHPEIPPSAPFDKDAMNAIRAGNAVPVWSDVLQTWLWWVRDEKARQKLLSEGCETVIYTLGELAVVSEQKMGPEALKDLHQFKKTFNATIEPPEAS